MQVSLLPLLSVALNMRFAIVAMSSSSGVPQADSKSNNTFCTVSRSHSCTLPPESLKKKKSIHDSVVSVQVISGAILSSRLIIAQAPIPPLVFMGHPEPVIVTFRVWPMCSGSNVLLNTVSPDSVTTIGL